MAIDPLGIVDHTIPQAMRLLNGTALETTQLGAAIVAGTEVKTTLQRPWRNRFCVFKQNLYILNLTSVLQFNFGAKTWASVKTLSFTPETNGAVESKLFWTLAIRFVISLSLAPPTVPRTLIQISNWYR